MMTLRKLGYCLNISFLMFFSPISMSKTGTHASMSHAHDQSSSGTIVPEVTIHPEDRRALLQRHALTPTLSMKTLLSRDLLNQSGSDSIPNALRRLAGVNLQDIVGNGSQTAISMRGFGSNASSNTLILMNGIPLNNPDLASANLNTIPLQAIEVIEVIAGTESVMYGDQAVAGIINITTRQDWQQRIEASCSFGSFNESSCYAWLAHQMPTTGIDFFVSPALKHTDNYRSNNAYDQQLLLGGMGWGQGRLRFNYTLGGERMGFPGALTHAQVEQNRRQATSDTDYFRDSNGLYSLLYEDTLGDGWQSNLALAYRGLHGRGELYSPFSQSRIVQFVKPQLMRTFARHTYRFGADIESDAYQLNSLFGITNERQQKYGVYALLTMKATEDVVIDLGARGAGLYQRLNSATSMETVNRATATIVGARITITPTINVYFRRASSFRFPKADENSNAPIGVHSLRTQRGVTYEGGLGISSQFEPISVGFVST